jgi:urea transport system permease protein
MTLKRDHLNAVAYVLFIAAILAAPLILNDFWLNRLAKYLVYGMLGVAVSLSWGYAGILNLGQGLFFGAGAYMLAMSLKLASPTSLQSSSTPVPDFMLWNSELGAVANLCCISRASFLWIPFQYEWFGLLMGIVLPTTVAALLGTLLFRRRIAGVFVSIITLAFVLMVRLLVIEEQPITNGFNGLTDLALLTIGNFQFDPYDRATYYLVALSLALTLVAARLLVETRAGLVLQGIRDDQSRARYLGFNVPAYQTFFFSVSAAIAGLAGMLYVVVAQFASPTFLDIAFSITMVIWAAVGGRGSLLGACIGAIVINMVEATASETEALLDVWRVIVGLGFVLAVLFLPRGIAGLGSAIADRIFAGLSGVRKNELVPSSAVQHAAE